MESEMQDVKAIIEKDKIKINCLKQFKLVNTCENYFDLIKTRIAEKMEKVYCRDDDKNRNDETIV